jgi:hypothetical protein
MKTTDKQVIEGHLDLEMLERPHLWPNENLIYVKREYEQDRETGPCVIDNGHYVIRRHRWGSGGLKDVGTLIYNDALAVCDDGWRVD